MLGPATELNVNRESATAAAAAPRNFWPNFFSGSQTDPCFQNKTSGCRLTGRKGGWVRKTPKTAQVINE